jgi:hypothetical protein
MNDNNLAKYTGLIFTGLFFAAVFIFFAFFYNSHLHFEEETQLFLLTKDFFLSKIRLPGGGSGYAGGFLTQFYFWSLAGPLIITLLLLGIQQVMYRILKSLNNNPSFLPVSFLPAINGFFILCDEFYPLSGIVGILLALLAAWLYTTINRKLIRFISGILLIVIVYWLAGGSYLLFLSVIIIFEIFKPFIVRKKERKISGSAFEILTPWLLPIYLVIAAAIPLLVRQFLILQPLGLSYITEFYYDMRTVIPKAITVYFALPALLMIIIYFLPSKEKIYRIALFVQIAVVISIFYFGQKLWINQSAEQIMTYDYLVREGRWNDVIKYADKNPPRNNLSLAMLNLSLAKTNKMGDLLFRYEQNGFNGLFLTFAKEYVAPMMGSEIFFQLGLINASQEYSFESTETTPNLSKSVRAFKRLAETNLINGQYEVSRKYLKLLGKTVFYRKWAEDAEKYLYNEEKINNHPVWGEKRRLLLRQDYFFKVQNMEVILRMMINENPGNNLAYQYLMAFYLLNKDLRNFMNNLSLMNTLKYTRIPVSYEEGILYVIGLTTKNPMANSEFKISNETKMRMQSYAEIYTSRPDAKKILGTRFGETFWYYLHYKQIEINPPEEKKEYH